VAVTIDDGYRDFLLHGQPVFAQYGIPVTVFLITGFIDRELWTWWDQITYLFHRTRRTSISFEGRELDLGGDLVRVIDVVTRNLKRLAANVQNARIEELSRDLAVQLPPDAPPEYEPLGWDEVRHLSSLGVEFGAHTRTHPILSLVTDQAELSGEILGSKRRLDEHLQIPCLHFAYPNGTLADYDGRCVACVQQAGFATAVAVERAFNYPGADRFRLARLDADPSLPKNYVAESLAGVPQF
jgi:peptidoglycan/xylan/chitin deacetylase (PgdA/CDA1 family)